MKRVISHILLDTPHGKTYFFVTVSYLKCKELIADSNIFPIFAPNSNLPRGVLEFFTFLKLHKILLIRA